MDCSSNKTRRRLRQSLHPLLDCKRFNPQKKNYKLLQVIVENFLVVASEVFFLTESTILFSISIFLIVVLTN